MNIVLVSSEVLPFSKTGGLADVAAALPPALRRAGCNVSVITPLYRTVAHGSGTLSRGPKDVRVELGAARYDGPVYLSELDEHVRVYLVGSPDFFDREGLYGTPAGDYPDNHLRFAFFARAALEVIRRYQLHPDIVHCNDWQTALLPVYSFQDYSGYFNTLLTIHNLGYQGTFPAEVLPQVGVDWGFYTLEGLEFWGKVSFLKGGLMFASRLSTVSPRYAEEIQSDPDLGHGLQGVLAYRGQELRGILNGVDYGQWDPAADPHLPARYKATRLDGKKRCKAALQERFGLAAAPETPVVGMVTRLDRQKGVDVVLEAAEDLLRLGAQLAVLGTGSPPLEDALRELAARHPGQIGAHLAHDEELAHLLIAGADTLLVPSRYEPCGLTQLYALRYGTVPVVHATGGLADTVRAKDSPTGFVFHELTADAMLAALGEALETYRNTRAWRRIMRNGMAEDFSWDRAAAEYIKLYAEILAAA